MFADGSLGVRCIWWLLQCPPAPLNSSPRMHHGVPHPLGELSRNDGTER